MKRIIIISSIILVILGITACAFDAETRPADTKQLGMESDPEAKALQKRFQTETTAVPVLQDALNGSPAGEIHGPITFGPGVGSEKDKNDQAAVFEDNRKTENFILYSARAPVRGRFQVDFRVDTLPNDHSRMTIFSMGTPGNTCLYALLRLDRRIQAMVVTRRETIRLVSDPVDLKKWHHMEFWFGPEGALLVVDGIIHDYSLDSSSSYSAGHGTHFYLGDQPWHSQGKGVFYRGDSFVGRLDNVCLEQLRLKQ